MNVHAFLVLIPNEYERWGNNYLNSKSALRNHLVGVLIYVTNDDIISAYVDVYVAFCYLFQVWKLVWSLEADSENRCGKRHFFVWNRIRIWRTGRDTPTKNPKSTSPREVWTPYLDNRRTLFSKICDCATQQATTGWIELWLVESERGIQQCHCLGFLETPINNYAKIICSGFEFYNYWLEVIGSLRKDVLERRTSTGSELFSLLVCLDANKIVLLSFFSPIKTIYSRVSTKPLPNDAKSPLPVDVRRSKTLP